MQLPSILSAAVFSLLALSVQHAAGLAMGPTTGPATMPTAVDHKEHTEDQKYEPYHQATPTPSMIPGHTTSTECPAKFAGCLLHSDDNTKFDYGKCDTKLQEPFKKCLDKFCPPGGKDDCQKELVKGFQQDGQKSKAVECACEGK